MAPHTGSGPPASGPPSRTHPAPTPQPSPAPPPRSACVLWHHPATPPPSELIRSFERHGATITLCTDRFVALAHACIANRRESTLPTPPPPTPAALLVVLVEPATLPGAAELVRALRRFAPASVAWAFEARAQPALRAVSAGDLVRWDSAQSAPVAPTALRTPAQTPQSPPARAQTPDSIPNDPSSPDLRIDRRRSTPTARQAQPPRLRLAGQDATHATGSQQPRIEPKPLPAAGGDRAAPAPPPQPAPPPAEVPPPIDPGELLTPDELAMLLNDDLDLDPRDTDAASRQDEPPSPSSASPRAS